MGASAPFHMHVPSGCTLCCHCLPLLLKGRTANDVCLLVMWPPRAAVGLGSVSSLWLLTLGILPLKGRSDTG